MATIAHRELRNDSSSVLARVAAGESFIVTNHGVPVAELTPIRGAAVDGLVRAGAARAPRTDIPLTALVRAPGLSSAAVLDDLRGDR